MEVVGQSYVPATDEHKLTQMIDVKTRADEESTISGLVKQQGCLMNCVVTMNFLPVEQSKNRNS